MLKHHFVHIHFNIDEISLFFLFCLRYRSFKKYLTLDGKTVFVVGAQVVAYVSQVVQSLQNSHPVAEYYVTSAH